MGGVPIGVPIPPIFAEKGIPRRSALVNLEFSGNFLIIGRTDATIIAVVAVLDIHIDMKAVNAMYPKRITLGFLPSLVMKNELNYFEHAMENPVRPLVAIIGGAKVSSKIGVIKNLSKRVDKILIGGGMMFTFLKSIGFEVGKSLVEEDMLDMAIMR